MALLWLLGRPTVLALAYLAIYAPFVHAAAHVGPLWALWVCALTTLVTWGPLGLWRRIRWGWPQVAGAGWSALTVSASLAMYAWAGPGLPAAALAQRAAALGAGRLVDRLQGRPAPRAAVWALGLALAACLAAAAGRWGGLPPGRAWVAAALAALGWGGKLWIAGRACKGKGLGGPETALGYAGAEQVGGSCLAALAAPLWAPWGDFQPMALGAGAGSAAVGLLGVLLVCSPNKPHTWAVAAKQAAGSLAVYLAAAVWGGRWVWWADGTAVICALAAGVAAAWPQAPRSAPLGAAPALAA